METTITIGAFVVLESNNPNHAAYGVFRLVEETATHLLLEGDKGQSFVLPKNIFTPTPATETMIRRTWGEEAYWESVRVQEFAQMWQEELATIAGL